IWVNDDSSAVPAFDEQIQAAAKLHHVDPNLIRAIMHLESTRDPGAFLGFDGRTVQPMNVHSQLWSGLQVKTPDGQTRPLSRGLLQNDLIFNINAGATIIRAILD
ncbi:MAG: hypothetical protein CUN56_17175, partial [Phototrophicales bacterium]